MAAEAWDWARPTNWETSCVEARRPWRSFAYKLATTIARTHRWATDFCFYKFNWKRLVFDLRGTSLIRNGSIRSYNLNVLLCCEEWNLPRVSSLVSRSRWSFDQDEENSNLFKNQNIIKQIINIVWHWRFWSERHGKRIETNPWPWTISWAMV